MISHEVILAGSTPSLEIGKSLTQQGFSQLYDGKPEAAFKAWQAAYRAYEQLNNEQGMNSSLINQSLALQALGSYTTACQVLTRYRLLMLYQYYRLSLRQNIYGYH
ncbi:hypothetical protein [Nostoc flagelliforme]|uniref:hypothetical protein n=1 Tax=Nostoc flagelliforme TaxID=1306274 RepID=UPI001686340B|nr:hypothetical protein [Nostoc flagelliforme]